MQQRQTSLERRMAARTRFDSSLAMLAAWMLTLVMAWSLQAEELNSFGLPNPPEADLPYLIHAGKLVATEHATASEERKNKQTTYFLAGVTSGVRTPLAGPEFLLRSESLDPNKLQLYNLVVRSSRREITFEDDKPKKNPQPYIVSAFPGDAGLFKLRVDASLERGEYCLTPEGSNELFCFTVY
jgi:hypothetical protein